jgi:hypothetical protein
MRETSLQWTEFTWLWITYIWVIFYLHTSWYTPLPSPPLRNWGLLGNSPAKILSPLLKMLRDSIGKIGN